MRNKVADIIKSHAEELTDDEAMVDKLLYEVKKLTEELQKTKGELASANQRINQLELNKNTQPDISADNAKHAINRNNLGNTYRRPA